MGMKRTTRACRSFALAFLHALHALRSRRYADLFLFPDDGIFLQKRFSTAVGIPTEVTFNRNS